tara:strand:- start:263 stop:436 length:174 start_codon:yes stop_codon:yes gene_type:complete
MGRVKDELFDWEAEEAEHEQAMQDPEMIKWNNKNLKFSIELQGEEIEQQEKDESERI